MIQALDCRWCGASVTAWRSGHRQQVCCTACGACGPTKPTREAAVGAWNHVMAMGGQVRSTPVAAATKDA